MPFPPVAPNLHEPFYIGVGLPSEIAFYFILGFNFLADFVYFLSGQIIGCFSPIDPCCVQNL